jgi:cytidylate kinase
MVITIDGPAASGKSTVAQELARKLGWYYFSTGMLYRGVAYIISRLMHKNPAYIDSLHEHDLMFISDLVYTYQENKAQLFFKNRDITPYLFEPAIDQLASIVSAYHSVRKALLDVQRHTAQSYNVIAEGRDCGSIVFPNALFKFFITASLEVRAQRKKDIHRSLHDIMEDIKQRDHRDENRTLAPLMIPQGALVLDTSLLTVQETVNIMLTHMLSDPKGASLTVAR